jgi:endonuclease/exonuclease/phosphatase family metal-dependent hydrolase
MICAHDLRRPKRIRLWTRGERRKGDSCATAESDCARARAGHGGGWRLDHIFASPELRPVRGSYHHDWRDDGLSDHSALEAELEPPQAQRG